jgi:Protein of unknown function (DUF3048) N-terminal domain/Protein of unknown function (DUF3048) C-terminal domain
VTFRSLFSMAAPQRGSTGRRVMSRRAMSCRATGRRAVAPALVVAALASACGGGAKKAAPSTTVATTAAPATTSTVARTSSSSSSTVGGTSTTAVPAPTYPFTGLPIIDQTTAKRPALAIKINNAASARPQHGLNNADIVFEEIVEGITRFMAVYQSTDAEQIGSIRSARTSDIDILGGLSHPLFVWSGGNKYVEGAIAGADVTDIGKDHHREIFWTGRKLKDYTEFFTSTEKAYALAPDGQSAPTPLFKYRVDGTVLNAKAESLAGVKLQLSGTQATWEWSDELKGWARSEDGTPHVDSDNERVAPPNVVVPFTSYRQSPADPKSPEAVTTGEGPLWVLTQGKLISGTWKRASVKDGYTLTDEQGTPILLTPGRTWVELAQVGDGEVMPVGS